MFFSFSGPHFLPICISCSTFLFSNFLFSKKKQQEVRTAAVANRRALDRLKSLNKLADDALIAKLDSMRSQQTSHSLLIRQLSTHFRWLCEHRLFDRAAAAVESIEIIHQKRCNEFKQLQADLELHGLFDRSKHCVTQIAECQRLVDSLLPPVAGPAGSPIPHAMNDSVASWAMPELKRATLAFRAFLASHAVTSQSQVSMQRYTMLEDALHSCFVVQALHGLPPAQSLQRLVTAQFLAPQKCFASDRSILELLHAHLKSSLCAENLCFLIACSIFELWCQNQSRSRSALPLNRLMSTTPEPSGMTPTRSASSEDSVFASSLFAPRTSPLFVTTSALDEPSTYSDESSRNSPHISAIHTNGGGAGSGSSSHLPELADLACTPPAAVAALAIRIWDEFIADTAPQAVNLPSSIRKTLETRVRPYLDLRETLQPLILLIQPLDWQSLCHYPSPPTQDILSAATGNLATTAAVTDLDPLAMLYDHSRTEIIQLLASEPYEKFLASPQLNSLLSATEDHRCVHDAMVPITKLIQSLQQRINAITMKLALQRQFDRATQTFNEFLTLFKSLLPMADAYFSPHTQYEVLTAEYRALNERLRNGSPDLPSATAIAAAAIATRIDTNHPAHSVVSHEISQSGAPSQLRDDSVAAPTAGGDDSTPDVQPITKRLRSLHVRCTDARATLQERMLRWLLDFNGQQQSSSHHQHASSDSPGMVNRLFPSSQGSASRTGASQYLVSKLNRSASERFDCPNSHLLIGALLLLPLINQYTAMSNAIHKLEMMSISSDPVSQISTNSSLTQTGGPSLFDSRIN